MMYVNQITLSLHLTGRCTDLVSMTKAIHPRMLNKGNTHMIQIKYTYSQWKECNSHIHRMDLKASQSIQRKHAQQQITTAYHNNSSIPGDEQSFTFGIPLTDRLIQPTSLLNAWLLNTKQDNTSWQTNLSKNNTTKTKSQHFS